jgi:hypothetical protein
LLPEDAARAARREANREKQDRAAAQNGKSSLPQSANQEARFGSTSK